MNSASPSPLPSDATPSAVPQPPADRVVLNSADLFKGTREIAIQHGESCYRLRLTKSGKLILHK